MDISANGIKLLAELEGCKLSPYFDSAKLLTCGIGHLVTHQELATNRINIAGVDVDFNLGITQQQAEDLLRQDLKRFEDAVDKVSAPLNRNQRDCLICFSFNIGVGAFLNSGVFTVANNGQYELVPAHLIQWCKSKGRTIQGLVNRRKKEIDLWRQPI